MAGKRERRRAREKKAREAALKPTAQQTPRQRLFTNEFKVGQKVSIIRHEHGWEDGAAEGIITELGPHSATVKSDEGYEYEINHPRDIRGI